MTAVLSGVGTTEEVPPGTGGEGPGTVVLLVDGGLELIVGRLVGRRPDLRVVDALARCQLAAGRAGCTIRLRDPCPELSALLELVGLADVVAAVPSGTSPDTLPAVVDGAGAGLVDGMEAAWRGFRATVADLGPAGLDQATATGWTAKEMLGHVAFWEETVEPVIVSMFRGGALPEAWAFGSGYTHPDGPWPSTVTHNAREAAWARSRPPQEVVARLDAAHARALEIVRSLTDDELQDPRYRRYLGSTAAHYDEHAEELAALLR